jgi:hypothetical protein
MAYDPDTNPIATVAQTGSFKFMHYATGDDALADVAASGYFNKSAAIMPVNSLLFIVASDGFGLMVVLSNAAGVVDLSDATPIDDTNTEA